MRAELRRFLKCRGGATTAFAMAGDEVKIRDGGCDAYIPKPISIPNFLQTVERLAEPLVAEAL